LAVEAKKLMPIKPAKQEPGEYRPERLAAYAGALHKSLEIFVSYTEQVFDDVMSEGLRPIAEAADLDRILIFRVWSKEHYAAGEIYRWDRIAGGSAPVDEVMKVLPVTSALKRWVPTMLGNACVSLRRSEFQRDEADFLSPRGVKSILIVPVFTEGDLWGVVTFQDAKTERDFDDDCVSLLRSAARLSVVTIIREEKTKSAERTMEVIRRHELMTDALNKASVTFLSRNEENFSDMMAAGVSLIAATADIDRLVLYRNQPASEGLRMSQVYRWDKEAGGSTGLIEAYTDIPYARFMPEWETRLAEGAYVNSPSRLLPGAEAATLQSFGIVSVAAIPVLINNAFWGFALFGDTRQERFFEGDVIEMMRSAAFLFANAFIRAEMEYDALTGVYNRRFFDENLKRIIKTLSRSESLLSLMMIDIDFFKKYNDAYGHLDGDKCLKIIAKTISQSITRDDDFVARYGGEEFVVVLPNTDEPGARLIAGKLLENVLSCNIPHSRSGLADHLTISIGATTGKVRHPHNADDFVKKADEMLYKSKRDGRNRYSFERL